MSRGDLLLNTKHEFAALSKISLRGGIVNIVAQIILFIVQISTLGFMARLISPTDFGVVAMAASITGFILIFKDLGLSMATVQKEEINEQQISNLFWINVIIGVILSLLVILISPFVASFFEEKAVQNILLISSLGLFIGALTIQHQALLRRQMRFLPLAIVDIISKVLGSIISIIIAFQLKNYWALVLLPIICSTLYLIGIYLVLPWKPKLYKKNSDIKDLVNFGKNMTIYGVINYFSRSGDNVIIGKFVGATGLGFYSRAYSLMMLPIGQLIAPLTGVMVPTLSRLQNQPEKFKEYYIQTLQLVAFLTLPLIATLGIMGKEVVLVVLGDNWIPAIKLYQILCLAAFWQPLLSTTGWILTSLNQTGRIVKWGWINSTLLIITFLIGINWGVIGITIAYAIYMWLIVIPNFKFVIKYTPINIGDFLDAVKKPIVYTSLLALALLGLLNSGIENLYLKVSGSIIIFISFWVVLYFHDKKMRDQLKLLIDKMF